MGRNARRRAAKRALERPVGVDVEPASRDGLLKCPRCGSTNMVIGSYMAGITRGTDVLCGNCNWQGMLEPGIW